MGIAQIGGSSSVSIAQPTLQRTLTSGTSVSDLPTGKEITAFIIGGGGGGGSTNWPGTTSGGGCGGAGGSIVQYVFTLPTSRTISYSIGAGGAGGLYNGAHGAVGGKTTFDGIIAFPGSGGGTGTPGHAAHGGGGGGAGAGNNGAIGGAGGVYGSKGQAVAGGGSYGGYPGSGRSLDLSNDTPIYLALINQGSLGEYINVKTFNPSLPQFGDVIFLDMRWVSGSPSSASHASYGGSAIKIIDFNSWTDSDQVNVKMDYNTYNPGGSGSVITSGYYNYIPSIYSRLTRIEWLRSAGITLPGGGGGGTGGGSTSLGGLGGGTGGRGAAGNGNGGATAGSVPGGGGGGSGGNTSNVASNGAAGGAGAIYLFWA